MCRDEQLLVSGCVSDGASVSVLGDLSVRTSSTLQKTRIRTVGRLCSLTVTQLQKKHFGPKSIKELRQRLRNVGRGLK